ncbi:hypothetical protein TNCV_42111 [Trichonephila clavipes]|nr:hypothetical protein TNCV_42111 [Trichonephila clavipes]
MKNQAALLKHLQEVTKQKLEAKLIGTKFRIYPQTPYSYHQIRRYINENSFRKLHLYAARRQDAPCGHQRAPHRYVSHADRSRSGDAGKYCTCTPRGVKCVKNHLAKDCTKPIDEKPKCCLCEGDHPANCVGCPKYSRHRIAEEKEKTIKKRSSPTGATKKLTSGSSVPKMPHSASSPPQPTETRNPPTTSTSTPKQNNNQEFSTDIFDELRNPAVQETFELLEQFIKI